MRTMKIKDKLKRLLRGLLPFMLLVGLNGITPMAEAAFRIPANRSVTWRGNVGVLNDIPTRKTISSILSPSGADDSGAIQTAINNCPQGQVVKLSEGTFSIGRSITLKSGITLRGAGMGTTILKGVPGLVGSYFIGLHNSTSFGATVDISTGFSRGSTSITTSRPHGWSVGDIILIDQMNNLSGDPVVHNVGNNGRCTWCGRSRGTRSLGQTAKVIAVPGSKTAILEIPLYWNYNARLAPQATKINGITKDAGIENLTVDNSLSGSRRQHSSGTFFFRGTSNCWLLRVEGIGAYGRMVEVYGSYRNTFRGVKLHEGVPPTPRNGSQYGNDRAYGFNFDAYNSANLVENCQLYHLRVPISMVGATSGNVIAYNYITELYSDSKASNFQLSGITTHGSHPMMNLIEGNYLVARLRADNVWGSSSHNTYFRNRVILMPHRSSGTFNIDLHRYQQYYNFIGNVIGTSGVENSYMLKNVGVRGKKSVFRFGYASDGAMEASGNDPMVSSTVLLHGNWDSSTNRVVWNDGYDRAFPASFYLTRRPEWWGNLQWPAIGPDVSPMFPPAPVVGSGTPWDRKAKHTRPRKPRGSAGLE